MYLHEEAGEEYDVLERCEGSVQASTLQAGLCGVALQCPATASCGLFSGLTDSSSSCRGSCQRPALQIGPCGDALPCCRLPVNRAAAWIC